MLLTLALVTALSAHAWVPDCHPVARPEAGPALASTYGGPAHKTPCSDEDLAALMESLKAQNFDVGRKQVVMKHLKDHWYTVDQVKKILAPFQFPDNKVDVAAKLYPRVTDQQNFDQIYDLLPF